MTVSALAPHCMSTCGAGKPMSARGEMNVCAVPPETYPITQNLSAAEARLASRITSSFDGILAINPIAGSKQKGSW